MTPNKTTLKKMNGIIISLILIASIGFGFQYFFNEGHAGHNNKSTQPLFAATFPDENGKPQSLKQYAGKIEYHDFTCILF